MSDTPTPTPAPVAPVAPVAAPATPPVAATSGGDLPKLGRMVTEDGRTFYTLDGDPVIPKSGLDRRLKGHAEKLEASDARIKDLEAQAARAAELERQLEQARVNKDRAVTFARLSVNAPDLGSERVQRFVLSEYEQDLAALEEGAERPSLGDWIEANKDDPFLARYLNPGSDTGRAGGQRRAPAGLNNGTNNQPPPATSRRYDDDEIARVRARNRGRLPADYAKGLREQLAKEGAVTAPKA